jgi:hypothetical protein
MNTYSENMKSFVAAMKAKGIEFTVHVDGCLSCPVALDAESVAMLEAAMLADLSAKEDAIRAEARAKGGCIPGSIIPMCSNHFPYEAVARYSAALRNSEPLESGAPGTDEARAKYNAQLEDDARTGAWATYCSRPPGYVSDSPMIYDPEPFHPTPEQFSEAWTILAAAEQRCMAESAVARGEADTPIIVDASQK